MAVLKRIKFGSTSTPIAMTQVAIDSESSSVLGVTPSNTGLDVNADPVYTISLAVDGKTIAKGANGLETSLALKVEEAGGEGASAKKARIALVDSNGGSGYAELSSVNIEDIVGDGIVHDASYNSSTGELTITWAGSTQESPKETVIDLGALLDIEDIIIKSDSTDYLSFAAVNPGDEDGGGQAQIGVKLADVTYTATAGSTKANLTVDTTNGKMLAADDAIPAIKSYVDDVLDNASATLAVTAEGDDYVNASVDAATDNKHVVVETNVDELTATAGTPGVYAADGSETTAPVAGTLSGTANSLADGADIATKVKTYVDGAIASEVARSDAKNKADIAALDVTDTAVAGQYVSQVSETDGKIAVVRTDVSGAVLNNYAKGTDELPIAATDTINQAFSKIEVTIEKNEQVTSAALNDLNDKIDAMNVTDAAVAGQYVSSVSEADGVISTTKANVSDAVLNGYAKGTKPASTAIAATDDVKGAIAKLEHQIDDAKAAATTKVVEGTDAGNNLSISSATSASDGSTTYTINLTDVASAQGLANEITRAQSAETAIDTAVGLTKAASGETRTWTPTSNYGGSTTSVKDNMQALDTQLKTVSDNLDAITYEVNGTELIFRGIEPYVAPQP